MSYTPPFTVTPQILKLALQVQELIGELKNYQLAKPQLKLRKENKIKTVHHSLAIEGNTLSEKQITALLENKRVVGPQKQITEVVNALKLYDHLGSLKVLSEADFLKAHKVLTANLVESSGKYRSKNVGVFKGTSIGHVAPQAKQVSQLMKQLFSFLKSNEQSFLIKACVFHYELEFIHPFEDGNGRMGRLWQQLILMKHSPIFEFLSVETLIHKKQKQYYQVLEKCDKVGDSTLFIEFSMELILQTLKDYRAAHVFTKSTVEDRLQKAIDHFGAQAFSRKDYLNLNLGLSTATASRDLALAVRDKKLVVSGDKALARYKRNS